MIIETIDLVLAMKLVFCQLIWAARRMHLGSPIVAAHTSGAIRFPVRRVIVRWMMVRCVLALVQATFTMAFNVWRSLRETNKSVKFSVVFRVRIGGYCCRLCCFLALVAAGVHKMMTMTAVWRKLACFPGKCPSSSCMLC